MPSVGPAAEDTIEWSAPVDLTRTFGEIWQSRDLPTDLDALCDCGGRFAGTPSEMRAREWARGRLAEAAGRPTQAHAFDFNGWERLGSDVALLAPGGSRPLDSTPLGFSPPTPTGGLDLDVVDLGLGLGNQEDFAAQADAISGRAVLVRHTYPFTSGHVHRRRKFNWAKDRGARAFLMACDLPGVGVTVGSAGTGDPRDIPALGLSYEAGGAIAVACAANGGLARIHLDVRTGRRQWLAENLFVEIPGQADEWVVLCAHLDGHDLAESALDNGTGVVTVLEVTRRLAAHVPSMRRGLRAMLFTVEEWGLWGSGVYVSSLSEAERRKIALAVNLDTVVGYPRLFALTGGIPQVDTFVAQGAEAAGVPITPIRPILGNSDHYNFFLAGIPTFRLIAGYDDPTALSRILLTRADTRDKVDLGQLRQAAMVTAALAATACETLHPPAHFVPPPDLTATPGWGGPPTK